MLKPKITNLKALETLIREGQRENLTKAGRKRSEAACEALGLSEGETAAVLLILEYPPPPSSVGERERE